MYGFLLILHICSEYLCVQISVPGTDNEWDYHTLSTLRDPKFNSLDTLILKRQMHPIIWSMQWRFYWVRKNWIACWVRSQGKGNYIPRKRNTRPWKVTLAWLDHLKTNKTLVTELAAVKHHDDIWVLGRSSPPWLRVWHSKARREDWEGWACYENNSVKKENSYSGSNIE
jgi:hypothetical protein